MHPTPVSVPVRCLPASELRAVGQPRQLLSSACPPAAVAAVAVAEAVAEAVAGAAAVTVAGAVAVAVAGTAAVAAAAAAAEAVPTVTRAVRLAESRPTRLWSAERNPCRPRGDIRRMTARPDRPPTPSQLGAARPETTRHTDAGAWVHCLHHQPSHRPRHNMHSQSRS